MPRYKIKTTVDITRSNPSREDTNSVRNGQQLNFNTLLQGIGMRANVEWDNDPQPVEYQDTKEWFWEFEAGQMDVSATKDERSVSKEKKEKPERSSSKEKKIETKQEKMMKN